ncbi:MAG: hypothetical protein DHS20C16_04780 [Phycisphaerae bacterium]|nr:MAG: hypothetical protein DHS20C16_04780 [Phycisphaerae bacterium]
MRQWVSSVIFPTVVAVFVVSVHADPTCTNFGDRNDDCRIDLVDHAAFFECISGPGASADPNCVCFDSDADNDVDIDDFRAFQQAFTGDQLLIACDMTPDAFEPAILNTPPVRLALDPLESRDVLKTYFETGDIPTGVYDFSGEFYMTVVDLRIASRGFDFIWSRKYRSKNGPSTGIGENWDFGYNIFLEQAGNDLIMHDGNSRADYFTRVSGPGGDSWCAKDFFRDITQEPNGTFVCTFPHSGEWRFLDLDGSPEAGKLSEIADPNGNTMTFAYDPGGRLTTIGDTHGRPITIAYNQDDQVSSVTDFSGRVVTYDYYDAQDTLGGAGDLKSVTTPTVTGTPHGNDFPNGKTTVYTYSTGLAPDALNHNLLTITDPKGQTYLTNTYAATINPLDLEFDRITRQVYGDPTDITDYVYETESPTSTNGLAVTRSVVNDRNGHVEERLYDKFNRCVSIREFTGSSNPSSPTSSSVNRPTNKLRSTDPDFFETRFEYNGDSLLARIVDAEGSIAEYTYEGDTSFLSSPRDKANLTESKLVAGPRGGNQSQLVTTFEYDANSNGATNRMTRMVDSRGNATQFDYDAAGNRTLTIHRNPSITEEFEYNAFGQLTAHTHPDNGSGHRRRDEMTYYNAGPQTGYVKDLIVDAPGFALTTTYEHDAVGNVVRTIDPRGNDTLQIVNELDQVVRTLSRPVDPGNSIRYEVDTFYDANDNIVQVDVQGRDETHTLFPNSAITTLYEYDILDMCTRATKEVDPVNNVVVEYEYDAERNRVLLRSGEATNGNQPTNTVGTVYDERDLVFQEIMAPGDPQQSTTQLDYDGNGNVVRTTQGLEGNPRVTTQGYDGYDRHMPTTDPMGNRKTCQYDENGNRLLHRDFGELLDVLGDAGNVRLTEKSFEYDVLDRRTRVDADHFDAATQNAIGDGLSSTIFVYSDNSQIISVTDDNSHTTTIEYDTANRQSVVTDAKNNTTAYTYDANSNVVTVTETEKSDLGLPDEVFVTTFVYDRLDRQVSTTDSSGNTMSYGYDSRDNRLLTVDARSTEIRCEYDGLDRLLTKTTDLDGDGADGDGPDIVLTQVWDDTSRLVQQVDANGNATVTGYDPLNRLATKSHADGTSESYTYDAHHNVINRVDANGSMFIGKFDLSNRTTSNTILPGPGVSAATTFEAFTYDGLSRATNSQDDGVINTFTWSSLSDMTEETTDGQATSSTYDGVGNRLTLTYPSGRTLDYNYDALDRIATIEDNQATITSYLYVGPERVTFQQYGNGARTTFAYDGIQGVPNPQLDFGSKCIVGITHSSGPNVIDSRTFKWDQMYNKTERRDTRLQGPQLRHAYQYDAAYRMGSALEEDRLGIPIRNTIYNLDGVGNRLSLGGFGGVAGPYFLDPASPPSDFQVNQYTQTPGDDRQYDENGNLAVVVTPVGTNGYEYDAYDRLVLHVDTLTGDTAEYAYDALGRRVRRTVTPNGGPPEETRYFYDGMNVIEDQNSNGATLASYVRGARGSDIVCVETGGEVAYHHSDDVGNVMALTDSNGVAVERYDYDDFGVPSIFDGAGAPIATSSIGNLYMFGGNLYDPETGWYIHGNRHMDPQNGRYVTRHHAGMWNRLSSFGNAYTFADGNPWSTTRGHGETSGRATGHRGKRLAPSTGSGGGSGGGHGSGGTRGHGNKAKFKAGADLSKKVNIAAGGGDGGHNGHVTVLKARGGGGHNGHVTVLKAHGGGGHNGHVTVLKARGGDGHNGHVTVLKARGGGGHNGHVTVLKARDDGGHNGHVTVLKAHGGGNHPNIIHFIGAQAAGGGSSGGSPAAIPIERDRNGGKSTGKRGPASGGGSHGGAGHMAALSAHGSGAAGHSSLPSVRAGGGGFCPPCGMWKAVCTNGRRTGEINILPACNNISSR